MGRIVIVVAGLAVACGSVDERGGCSVSADCPAGQYCAHTPDGSVCWADAVAPVVEEVVAGCASACRRDSILHVTATVTEATSDVLDASVALDLPGGPTVPMAWNGSQWEADVELRRFPFEHFERNVVASVTARDGARNVSAAATAAAVGVTRLRWERAIDGGAVVSPTVPAVKEDGTVVVGGSNGKLYLVSVTGEDAAVPLPVGTGQVTAAPAIGEFAIWVGSEDFNLYAVELDGSMLKAGVGVNLGGPVKGSVAVLPAGAKEWAFATATAGDGTGIIGVSSTAPSEENVTSAPSQESFTAGPMIGADDRVHATSATVAGAATLRSYVLGVSPIVLKDPWTALVGRKSSAPLATDGFAVFTGSDDSPPALNKTIPGTTPVTAKVGELAAVMTESVLVLAGGDVIAGDESGRLYRFAAAGPAWSPAPALGAPIRGPLALTGTSAPLVVPTNAGKVFALTNDGQIRWQGTLPSASGLRAANIHTPPGQTDPVMSYAYFASGTGRLYSVVVDGQLDASAPWPKAFHDPRNTNRAGPQP